MKPRITLEALAAIAGVSPYGFARRFRASTGESLASYLQRLGLRSPPERPRTQRPRVRGLATWQVRKATDHLSANLDRNVPLSELAGLLSMSRGHFCTAFHRSVGVSPREWTTLRRMERARLLLEDERLEITEIALMLGYTPSAFGSAFRRRFGTSPSAFRRSREAER